MKNYVCGFAVTNSGMISLIEKNKPDWQKGRLNGLGGKIEEGESIYEAMSREFKEEAGFYIPCDQWDHRLTLTGEEEIIHFFLANVEEEFKLSECVEGKISWYSVQNALNDSRLISNLKWVIPFSMQKSFVKIEVMMK